jgi:hypothetical protein
MLSFVAGYRRSKTSLGGAFRIAMLTTESLRESSQRLELEQLEAAGAADEKCIYK